MKSILIVKCSYNVPYQFSPFLTRSLYKITMSIFYRPLDAISLMSFLLKNNIYCNMVDLRTCFPFKRKSLIKNYLNKYDFIIFLSNFSEYPETIKIAQFCKEINPNLKIILGGLSSFLYKEILKYNFIDYVILGEPEIPLLNLLSEKNKSNVPGIAYRKDSGIVNTPQKPIQNLDYLSFSLWNRCKAIYYNYFPEYPVITSRGCPFNCSFCVESRWYSKIRFKSPKFVGEELEMLDNKKIILSDLNFSISKNHVRKVCDEIKKRKLEFPYLSARAHVDTTDKEILKMMADSGFTTISFGVESLSPFSLRSIKKTKNPVNYVRKCIKLLKYSNEIGLNTYSFFIIPLPGQTKKRVLKEIALLNRYSDVRLYFLTPFPGTYEWERLKNKLTTNDFSLFDAKHLVFKSKMPKEEIKEIERAVYPFNVRLECFFKRFKHYII